MKKIIRKTKYIFLGILCGLSFTVTACTPVPVVQQGIVITSSSEQSEGTSAQPELTEKDVSLLEENVFRILLNYTQANVVSNVPQATVDKLHRYAEGVTEIVAGMSVSYNDFSALNELLALDSTVQAVADFSLSSLSPLYGKIASAVGFDQAGRLTYRLTLFYYDMLYEQSMERYEKYGYSYLLKQAEGYAAEKELLQKEVGENNFLSAVQTVCDFCSLSAEGLQNGFASLLSESEILTLLQAQKSTNISLSAQGWDLLLTYLQRLNEKNYLGELLSAAEENGDKALLAAEMNDIFSLLRRIQQKLTVTQTALLRQGKTEELISSLFPLFGEEEWALFEEITGMPLSDGYDDIAEKYFGEEYERYVQDIRTYSLTDLKNATGEENFIKILEGYAAGICPAIAYGIFR